MSEKHTFEFLIDAPDGREGGMSLRQAEIAGENGKVSDRAYVLTVRDYAGREIELKLFMNATRRFPRSRLVK